MNARWLLTGFAAQCLVACSTPTPVGDSSDVTMDAIEDRSTRSDVTSLDGGTCVDEDNDGHPSAACGGDDCDDRNPRANPGVREVCDNAGVDEDCDPCTVAQVLPSGRGGDGDQDEDGFASVQCFNRTSAGSMPMCAPSLDGGARVERVRVSATEVRGTDCADDLANGATRFPGATEQCNNLDDNCDGVVDEGVSVQCFPDVDGDGFAPTGSVQSRACPSADPGRVRDFGACPPGTTNRAPTMGASDCNDGMGGNSVFPGATEQCNNADDNCDGTIDDGDPGAGASCMLMSMSADPGVCRNEARIRCVGGTLQCAQSVRPGERLEMCNALDDDCDDSLDEPLCVDATVDALGRQSAYTGFGSCAGTTCNIASCVDGRGDCNGQQSDGCEVDLRGNANHCGACGVQCSFGSACVQGVCAPQTLTSVRTGSSFSCLLHADGRVFCWGNNDSGQLGDGTLTNRITPTPVVGLTDAVELSLGGIHACARRRSGAVSCWGSNAFGRLGDGTGMSSMTPVAVTGLTDAVEISLGSTHSCARRATGEVLCWGPNTYGQLGDRSMTARLSPVSVASLTNAISISAGFDHSCAVTMAGAVYCWGRSALGQLGNASTSTNQSQPVVVNGVGPAREVRAGNQFTCARLATNAVSCWGNNASGQLGTDTGAMMSRAAPATVSAINDAQELSAGSNHVCARRANATVWCWGANGSRQLGDGSTSSTRVPTMVPGVRNAVEVTTRYDHTCIRRASGHFACWGSNSSGQLGTGTITANEDRVGVAATSLIAQIDGGERHACARRVTGEVLCWGSNANGQLGDGTTTARLEPVLVSTVANVLDLAAGQSHTCAIRADRSVWCWGRNNVGQLGDGSTTDRLAPVMVTGISDAVQLAAGAQHTCARRANGAVVCWGFNGSGQLGDGATADRSTPFAVSGLTNAIGLVAGHQHTCARRLLGDVVCWGSNTSGQLGDGTTVSRAAPVAVTGLSLVFELSAGASHTCARLLGGAIRCWGANDSGQLGNGTTTASLTPVAVSVVPASTRFVALTSGAVSNCARTTNNDVMCWGDNRSGQQGERTSTIRPSLTVVASLPTNVREVSSGWLSHYARRAFGLVIAWGASASGQLSDGSIVPIQYIPVSTAGIND